MKNDNENDDSDNKNFITNVDESTGEEMSNHSILWSIFNIQNSETK